MVLKPSDYKIENLWSGSWDPTSPRMFVRKAVGTVLALSFVGVLLGIALNQGVPYFGNLVARFSGGRVGSDVSVF